MLYYIIKDNRRDQIIIITITTYKNLTTKQTNNVDLCIFYL